MILMIFILINTKIMMIMIMLMIFILINKKMIMIMSFQDRRTLIKTTTQRPRPTTTTTTTTKQPASLKQVSPTIAGIF